MIKSLWIIAIMAVLLFMGCFCALIWKWTCEVEKVMIPVHISLDTSKYKILKEDFLTLDGMKIKRVYYLEKNGSTKLTNQ